MTRSAIDPSSADHKRWLLDKILWVVSELDNTTSRSEAGSLKEFFSMQKVTVRLPYNIEFTEGNKICSHIASVNEIDFLKDRTGNRRFAVIEVNGLDHEHDVDVLQLHLQALELFRQDYRYWLNEDEIKKMNARNQDYIPESTVGAWIKEKVRKDPAARTASKTLFHDYTLWCEHHKFRPLHQNTWARELRGANVERKKLNGYMHYACTLIDPEAARPHTGF